jgi:hypothetical protein
MDNKDKYRTLIYRLQSVVGSTNSAKDQVDKIKPELDKRILINDNTIEDSFTEDVKADLEDARNHLYDAIRNCYNSMNEE